MQKGEFIDEKRAIYGCTRADLERVPWKVDPIRIRAGGHMGRLPIYAPDLKYCGIDVNPELPFEDPAEGCPAGWYRSRFIASLLPYLRRRDGNGGRVQNLMLDRTDDEVIIQLAMLAEDEQERWENYRVEAMFDG